MIVPCVSRFVSLQREAARRGGDPYDEHSYMRAHRHHAGGSSSERERERERREAEAAAAYYASRGRSARTREEAIAHERARMELLARGGGGHRHSSYPRTYAEFNEEFDGEIPPLRNVPPEVRLGSWFSH